MKVFIVAGSGEYRRLFESLGHIVTSELSQANLVCFTGGADVSPELYGDNKHRFTGNDPARDKRETTVFDYCQKHSIPTVGICRGGQFLNVMSGGRMYQHVEKHTGPHTITDLQTGETIYVSSTHHQMMMMGSEGVLVASSSLGGSREWYDGNIARKDVSKQDIEVVYYPNTNSLCFQPHPEFNSPEYEGMKRYFASVLERYLGVK